MHFRGGGAPSALFYLGVIFSAIHLGVFRIMYFHRICMGKVEVLVKWIGISELPDANWFGVVNHFKFYRAKGEFRLRLAQFKFQSKWRRTERVFLIFSTVYWGLSEKKGQYWWFKMRKIISPGKTKHKVAKCKTILLNSILQSIHKNQSEVR